MESLALAFSGGWASGINAYLVVLVLGIADRVDDLAQIPDVLGRWDVLTVAGFMFAMEFVADKIPYIDSTWDAISTAIRPTVGAVIGVLLAGDATTLDQAVLGVVGGGTALLSHLVKAGGRLAINSSPEPVSNIVASLDRGRRRARGRVASRSSTPSAAAVIAAVLLAGGLVVLYLLARLRPAGLAEVEEPTDAVLAATAPAVGCRHARRGDRRRLRRPRLGRPAGQARPRRHPARAQPPPSAVRCRP